MWRNNIKIPKLVKMKVDKSMEISLLVLLFDCRYPFIHVYCFVAEPEDGGTKPLPDPSPAEAAGLYSPGPLYRVEQGAGGRVCWVPVSSAAPSGGNSPQPHQTTDGGALLQVPDPAPDYGTFQGPAIDSIGPDSWP